MEDPSLLMWVHWLKVHIIMVISWWLNRCVRDKVEDPSLVHWLKVHVIIAWLNRCVMLSVGSVADVGLNIPLIVAQWGSLAECACMIG